MVITELDAGGAEQAFVRLAGGLQTRGWRVDVVSLRGRGPLSQPLEDSGIPVTALGCRGLADVRCATRLQQHVRRQAPDVLLSFLHQANLYGRLAAWWAGVPVVVSGIRVADRRRAVVWPERLTRRLVTHYVACGNAVAEEHRRLCHISATRMSVILNGVDSHSLRQAEPLSRSALGIPDDALVLAFVGRITQQKGLDLLLAALQRLPESATTRYTLLVAGEGPDRKASETVAQAAGLPVRFLGRVDPIGSLYRTADVVVIPSRWEGTPNVLLESLACGTPVLAAAVDGICDIADQYPGVRLFSGRNIQDLATFLTATLADPTADRRAAGEAQTLISERLTWDAAITKYHELLLRLRSKNSPP